MIQDHLDAMKKERSNKSKPALKLYILEKQIETLDIALKMAVKHLNDACKRDVRDYLAWDTRDEIEDLLKG